MSCFRLASRSGEPTAPRKYLLVTMLTALTDQESGNSTPRCSKLTDPSRQFVITTSRRSQVNSSYGCTPSVVHTRSPPRHPPTAAPSVPGLSWARLPLPSPAPDDAPTALVIPSPFSRRSRRPDPNVELWP